MSKGKFEQITSRLCLDLVATVQGCVGTLRSLAANHTVSRSCRTRLLKWRTTVWIRTFRWWRLDLVRLTKYSIHRVFIPQHSTFSCTSEAL